ncbi:Stromalin conservative domain [Lasallia pustulata]|uniref:Stromalin conservative domain n=1 Tax=Lasallia pustulata TaxID=136370 RepID=A0A1W5D5E5_9LECA|nr:Stromalin conservative domain [Lasallia pustulata]
MELSDPATPDNSALPDATNRRKSGRARQKPVTLYDESNVLLAGNGGAKRKRAVSRGGEAENVEQELEEDESPEESESDPDEEELKERRKRAARSKKAPNKPAAKKPKTARSATTNLALRPAANGFKTVPKPRKTQARQSTVMDDGTGLYAEVFAQEDSMDDVAAGWVTRYQVHQTNAMCDLINFILKCTGCNLQVDVHDIEDPDNVASKLTDLQEEYQAQRITDYPLISKAKTHASFRPIVTSFFRSLIATAHASSLLYNDEALIENIEAWVTAMSSSGNRPFRHTATVIALSISTAVCGLVTEIIDSTAKTMRQKEGEKKKKTVNKGRVASLQNTLNENEKKQGFAEGILRDLFDAVFVHRYRDVDSKVRVDCVTALGTWITTLPDIFFEGQYLRYLGWVLSDTSAPTRAEVIKQLSKLFKHKDNVGRLRAFTERFRPRMVEMAARDAEPSIRASSVELLDLIRDAGLLEPDDIDTIGRLIFDTEPRVRKAVAGFFAENINDHFESTIEELGGEESIDEALGEEDEKDFDTPRKSWLKLKCLAEVLRSCDSDDQGNSSPIQSGVPGANDSLAAMGVDSRFSLAAQAICNGLPEVKEWEILAGYLLYDHSSTGQTQASGDVRHSFLTRCQPSEKEEFLLLEVLNAAVKQRLNDAVEHESDKKGKKSKARKDESREIQETTAVHLVQVIPRLLKKFGASSATASAVLRLEHVLNLEIFQELRQDSTTFSSLLDDINKQFLTHTDQNVLAEASTALLHARGFEDLEEVTDGKVQELWEDTINALRVLTTDKGVDGGSDNSTDLCNTVRRIANLASISDGVQMFDTPSRKSAKAAGNTPLELLIDIIRDADTGQDADEETDETIINAMKAVLFYYMWTARSLHETLTANSPLPPLPDYSPFSSALISVLSSRPSRLDPVRLAAAGTLLDLYTLFATFRHQPPPTNLHRSDSATDAPPLASLVREIPAEAQTHIAATFAAAEKAHAKKSHRALDLAADDDDPLDPDLDSDAEDSDADNAEDERAKRERQHEALLAEKRLCELAGKIVLAVVGRVVDAKAGKGGLRERDGLENRENGKRVTESAGEDETQLSRAKTDLLKNMLQAGVCLSGASKANSE